MEQAPGQRLWRHPDFLRLWAAQAVSTFGARIAREGLPYAAVITLHAGPGAIGVLAALRLSSQGLVGLVVGPLADRLPKRSLLISADLARAVVLILVPGAALLGRLSLLDILAAGALMGAFSVIFDIADHAYLPELLTPEQLIEGNSKLGATEAIAEIGGPALYGVLFSLMAPPLAVGVNAITYLASALLLGRIGSSRRVSGAHPAAEAKPFNLSDGFRLVLTHPLVRPIFLSDVTRGFFGGFFSASYLFLAIRWLHLTPFMLGLTVACGGIGALAGAALAPGLARSLGAGPTIVFIGAVGAGSQFLIPLAGGPPLAAMGFLCAAQLIGDGLMTAADINAVSLRQTVVRPAELGRAAGAFQSGQGFTGVAGALAGAWVGDVLGPRDGLFIAAAGITLAALFVAASPLPRLHSAA